MSKKIQVGLIGAGTVGAGVVRALLEKRRLLEQRTGARIVLRRICDKDFRHLRGLHLPSKLTTTDAADILRDPEIQIVDRKSVV